MVADKVVVSEKILRITSIELGTYSLAVLPVIINTGVVPKPVKFRGELFARGWAEKSQCLTSGRPSGRSTTYLQGRFPRYPARPTHTVYTLSGVNYGCGKL